ncbi:MAG: UDP-N-acetylmuramate dehydrogenase [Planctomycetota bacterium]|jgi:UDP-N-acetylmuramate dehydrogenase
MKVGGQAEWLLEPQTPDELQQAWAAAHDSGLPVRLLGAGADLIVDDGVHRGVVIATTRVDRIFRPGTVETETPFDVGIEAASRVAPAELTSDPRLVAWCGASLPGLVRAASELGWSGLEGLVGVPGKVGGAIATNAGGRWGDIWDVVESLRVLTSAGEVLDLDRKDCSPSYRDGQIGKRVVVAAVLRLEPESKAQVKDRARQYLLEKNRVQPVTEACAGCIFKNPDKELSDGRSAGQLIHQLGLRGLERGGAVVSPLHGNFIINRGGALAQDVFGLIDELKKRVADETGVELECEVRRWLVEDN